MMMKDTITEALSRNHPQALINTATARDALKQWMAEKMSQSPAGSY